MWAEFHFNTVAHMLINEDCVVTHIWQVWATLKTLKDREGRHKYA